METTRQMILELKWLDVIRQKPSPFFSLSSRCLSLVILITESHKTSINMQNNSTGATSIKTEYSIIHSLIKALSSFPEAVTFQVLKKT